MTGARHLADMLEGYGVSHVFMVRRFCAAPLLHRALEAKGPVIIDVDATAPVAVG
jgi:hypothetical protein